MNALRRIFSPEERLCTHAVITGERGVGKSLVTMIGMDIPARMMQKHMAGMLMER